MEEAGKKSTKGYIPSEALKTTKQRLRALATRRRKKRETEAKKINAVFSKETVEVL